MKSYIVKGMTCNHCVKAIKTALEKLPGVQSVDINLEQGKVNIEGNIDQLSVKKAIENEGYELA